MERIRRLGCLALATVGVIVPFAGLAWGELGDVPQHHGSASACVKHFPDSLRANLAFPGSEEYADSIGSYWRAQENTFSPSCVVLPQSAEDVAAAVWALAAAGDKASACKFAIRAGGHTTWHGASNLDNGVVIDLRQLKEITVNHDRTVASVGTGAVWIDVYRTLQDQGLTVVGGRAATIGVGGLTLGGGVSFFSARKGFACDNVVNFEVVLADGHIVNANAGENADLWRALKGGSNNFGVVTRFDLKAFEQGDFWGGQVVYSGGDTAPPLFDAFANLNSWNHYDENVALLLSFTYLPGADIIAAAYVYDTSGEENPKTFQPFLSVEPQLASTTRVASHANFTEEFASAMPSGQRLIWNTNTFRNDREFLTTVYRLLKETTHKVANVPGVVLSVTFQPINTKVLRASQERGENVLGLHPSQGPLVLCLITAIWAQEADDFLMGDVSRRFNDAIVTASKQSGLFNDWVYLNYASSWQDPLEGYGTHNKRRLRAASRKYDPEGVFQKLVPGGFKLF